MRKVYQRPAMKYKKLVNEKRIAAVCWGNHDKYGENSQYWYDPNHEEDGFYRFSITSGYGSGCDLNSMAVVWFDSRTALANNQYTSCANGSDGYTNVYNYILSVCKNSNANENYMSNGTGRIEDGTPEDS